MINEKNEVIESEEVEITKEDFEFDNEEFVEEEFTTKPIGYLKDAFIRFRKSKINIVASSILLLIILLAIFVPLLSSKNVSKIESEFANLPPRIPLLSKLGIFDGTTTKEGAIVDLNNFDEETQLYLPNGIDKTVIDMKSLTNYEKTCNNKSETCIGGKVLFKIDNKANSVAYASNEAIVFDQSKTPIILINISEFRTSSENAKLEVYVKNDIGDYILIDTMNESGIYEINVFDIITDQSIVNSEIKLKFIAAGNDTIVFNSVEVKESDNSIYLAEGYTLSEYTFVEGEGIGNIIRESGTITLANYKFKNYEAALGNRDITIGEAEYNELIAKDPSACATTPDPDNSKGLLVADPEKCAIVKVNEISEDGVVVDGNAHVTYKVTINYARYKGYDGMPYFLFGTTQSGHDLFKLVWIGIRTSLIIGTIVTVINILIGIVYGAISGYYGGRVDLIMQRISEVVARVPFLVILSIVFAYLGPQPLTLILVLVFSGWIGVASVTRTQFYRYKGREYVLASRTLGARDRRLIFRHILPNGIGTIITASILMIPSVIFIEATISFLGFGIGHGTEFNLFGIKLSGLSVGVLISDGQRVLEQYPHLTFGPALIISILMITFNMFGNALRDAFNPALRGS